MATTEEAIIIAKQHFKIHPLRPNTKLPLLNQWQDLATFNTEQVQKWWEMYPNANIGIKTGGNLVVIDVDNKGDKNGSEALAEWCLLNEALPETLTVKTPTGGYHYYYMVKRELSNKVDVLFKGSGIDIRGKGGYVVAPYSTIDGKGYEVINNRLPNAANEAVYFLCEGVANVQADYFILPGTIEQGTRDITIFKYACSLQAKGFSDDEIIKLVHKANNERCTPPLPSKDVDSKIKSALRYKKGVKPKDSTNEGLYVDGKLNYKNAAQYVISTYDIVSLDGELRKHDKGRIYKSYTEADNDTLLIDVLNNSTVNQRKEIFPYIRRYAPEHNATKNCIAFLNGVFDLSNQSLKPYDDSMYLTACIPHNFNIEAADNKEAEYIVGEFFKAVSCNDEEVITLLLDIIAYCFIPGNPWQKTFFIFGSGGNGKGTYFNLITKIYGSDKVEFKTWQELSSAKGRASIIDKLIVLCNDINDTFIKEPQALKTLVSCEPQTVKYLYQDEFTAIFNGKIISSGNAIPRVNDTSNGWQRRLILIPFEADFREKPDVTMTEKLTSEPVVEYIICKAIARLPIVLKNGFDTPKRVKELTEEYRLENNPVALFLKECGKNFKGKENAKVLDTIYQTYYYNFCNENGYRVQSKNTFAKNARAAGLIKTRYLSEPFVYYVE